MDAMGIEMFPQLNEYSAYSNTVSAMKAPAGMDSETLKKEMMKSGITIAGGQAHLKGKIFRIGNMGNVSYRDILSTLQQIEVVFKKREVVSDLGPATEAAIEVLCK
jgi:aspartate aminotransferase-like enzyme